MKRNQLQIKDRPFLSSISIILIIAFLHLIVGCHYYQTVSSTVNPEIVEQVQNANKFVILHQGSNAWQLNNITLNNEKNEMSGNIKSLSENFHSPELQPNMHRYLPNEGYPPNEIHIYISEYIDAGNSAVIIPYASILKISVFKKAIGATVTSYLFPIGVGSAVSVAAIIYIIILLTKTSCPFVYISDGDNYRFMGEMYGGAIYKSLERDDYMPLPGFNPVNGDYILKITNELLERQYTDMAGLIVVQHPANSQVLLDNRGVVQTILAAQPPVSAVTGCETDQTKTILLADSSLFSFNGDDESGSSMNSLTLCFNKPETAKSGKLILNAKNSLWFDYVFGKFNGLFGDYYNAYAEKQKHADPAEKIEMSLAQGIPLSVYIETDAGCTFVDYFNPVGPLASRDLVMPVDLSNVKGDQVKIKLECGYMFWEIDYAAMDFSENLPVEISGVSPYTAIDENGKERSYLLTSSDKKYLYQPEAGNEVLVKYKAPTANKDLKQSVFLHSRGYYEYIRDYKGTPDIEYLKSFNKQGALSRFSKQMHYEFIYSKDLSDIKLN